MPEDLGEGHPLEGWATDIGALHNMTEPVDYSCLCKDLLLSDKFRFGQKLIFNVIGFNIFSAPGPNPTYIHKIPEIFGFLTRKLYLL